MAELTFLNNWIIAKFILPFLLIFFIVFAILEKTKMFGEGKKQLNALVAFVIGLIFVGVAYPKDVVSNLILFLTVAIVVVFVVLILWGFTIGGDAKIADTKMKGLAGVAIVVAVIVAVLWATGTWDNFWNFLNNLFTQDWSKTFWTNVFFVIAVAAALAVVLISKPKGG